MTGFETIRLEQQAEGVTRITLARSRKQNALNGAMIGELTAAAERIASDATQRALIIAGEGKSFCAGGDLDWMREQFEASPGQRRAQALALSRMLHALDELPQLVIGIVNGAAFGGGVGLAAICDIVIAGPQARFALTETRLGLIPATIAPFLLRKIGQGGLRRIGLHGQVIESDEAKSLGLVSELAGEAEVEFAAERHVRQLLDCAPEAVAQAKALFRILTGRADAGEQAVAALVQRWQSDEAQCGIRAFFAKEAPPWKR
jgi:methylglutaconyl-CoA hydratase